MSEYDLKLYEDDSTNRMQESLKLFKEICNNKWFAETSMILFLNKCDLLQEKLLHVTVKQYIGEYIGDNSYEDVVRFFRKLYLSKNKAHHKVYYHVTCATNTDNVRVVFKSVADTIHKRSLIASGIKVA